MGARRNISGLDLAAGVGSVRRAWSDADQSVTTTTITNITDLVIPLESFSTYFYRAFIIYSAGATGDLEFSHSAPLNATMRWGDATNAYFNTAGGQDVWSGAGGGIANGRSFGIDGFIETFTTAANLQARFAQAAADTTATTIHAGSWMRVERVA